MTPEEEVKKLIKKLENISHLKDSDVIAVKEILIDRLNRKVEYYKQDKPTIKQEIEKR